MRYDHGPRNVCIQIWVYLYVKIVVAADICNDTCYNIVGREGQDEIQ